MGTIWLTVCGILIIIFQASHVACYTCAPGFDSDIITFKVPGEQLRQGMRLGKVNFTDCTDRTTFLFSTDDDHFMVQIDGTLVVKRQVLLHEGHQDFFIHSWDSQGHKLTVSVMVLHQDGHHLENQIPQNHRTEVDSETAADQHVSVLHFPKSDEGMRRRKREWILPPINIMENTRGQFPQKITQVRSDEVKKIHYSISGPGADQPPVGLFIMDKDSGILYITQALDRESQATYTLLAHAVEEGSSATLENVLEVRINVVDQNDNKPVFTNDTFAGDVAENSPIGFEVIKVEATDADDPGTDNADIRYRIVSQEPQEPSASMFVIDPVTGGIRVDADGLDREKYPQYTLVVEAADMGGVGLTGNTKVILSVTQSKDNAPDFIRPATADDQHVPVINFPKSDEGLRRRKRGWVIPEMSVQENARGKFPQKITQIRSDEDIEKKIYYSITGPGANLPPVKLFTIDRDTGVMYVTQPLDRERQAVYVFTAHAVAEGAGQAEQSMDIVVKVIDQNDNHPVFSQSTYLGEVAEASPLGHEVIQVNATDLDEPDNLNSIIRYSIVSQNPEEPSDKMFVINEVTGMIRVNSGGLDRETIPQYTLVVRAADGEGLWLSAEAKVILKVMDSNDNAPIFTQSSYEASVPENKVDAVVIKMEVTDGDEPNSPAWKSKFKIILGDPGNLFTVETGPNKQEGILKTVKGLDFERSSKHTLLVTVENEVPFAVPLPTSTATVVVTVLDVENEVGVDTDPDTARKLKVLYNIISDPAGWLNIADEAGLITVKCPKNRDSQFLVDGKYTALIGVYGDDTQSATGTSTLTIQLEDVNVSTK